MITQEKIIVKRKKYVYTGVHSTKQSVGIKVGGFDTDIIIYKKERDL